LADEAERHRRKLGTRQYHCHLKKQQFEVGHRFALPGDASAVKELELDEVLCSIAVGDCCLPMATQ
jgi:hypothetical protein